MRQCTLRPPLVMFVKQFSWRTRGLLTLKNSKKIKHLEILVLYGIYLITGNKYSNHNYAHTTFHTKYNCTYLQLQVFSFCCLHLTTSCTAGLTIVLTYFLASFRASSVILYNVTVTYAQSVSSSFPSCPSMKLMLVICLLTICCTGNAPALRLVGLENIYIYTTPLMHILCTWNHHNSAIVTYMQFTLEICSPMSLAERFTGDRVDSTSMYTGYLIPACICIFQYYIALRI